MWIKTRAQVIYLEKTENSCIFTSLVLLSPSKASFHSNSCSQQLLQWQKPVVLKMAALPHARLCRRRHPGLRRVILKFDPCTAHTFLFPRLLE